MTSRAAPWRRRKQLGLVLAAAVAAMVLTQAVRSGGDDSGSAPPALAANEPITQVDARFLAAGWAPQPEQEPLPLERKLAGNNLASLSACSGTGEGFCRYDYQQGHQRISVVTVPGSQGNGVVHSWFTPD